MYAIMFPYVVHFAATRTSVKCRVVAAVNPGAHAGKTPPSVHASPATDQRCDALLDKPAVAPGEPVALRRGHGQGQQQPSVLTASLQQPVKALRRHFAAELVRGQILVGVEEKPINSRCS